jgi:hypothetical protein
VRPGNHNVRPSTFVNTITQDPLTDQQQGRPGFFIRAYRNLTSVSCGDSTPSGKCV